MNVVALARVALAGVRWWLAADDPLGPVDQDPDQVRDDACHIVSSDPGVCAPPDTAPSNPSGGSGGGGAGLDLLSLLFWVLLVAAVVLLVVVAVRAAMRRGWVPARRGRGRADAEAGDGDELERGAVAVDRSREPTDWRAEAEGHRREGRYRDALRCRYRALVGDLARRGLIDEIPGRTTGEERAQLRVVRPLAASPFDVAADLFDGAWYGHADIDATDDDRFQSLARDVLGGVGERV